MAEPSVRVDDAMVERAVRVLFEDPNMDGDWTWDDLLREDGPERAKLWRDHARAILVAAFSQPTPTAETCICNTGPDTDGPNIECPIHGMPPRIEDMAPGTTLYGATDEYSAVKYVVHRHNGRTILWSETLRMTVDPKDIDPSTIRDVKPPAVTS